MINEYLLQYIWEHTYFNTAQLRLITGEELLIKNRGQWNKNQGPDFLMGAIKINSETLIGNIELHIKSSDWFKHHHQNDVQYKNIILHVVWEVDNNAPDLPTLELKSRVSKMLLKHYAFLMSQPQSIACANMLKEVPDDVWSTWKDTLVEERLQRKATHISVLLKSNQNHWEEVTWWMLARAFGSPVNAEAFELLAQSIPIVKLLRESHALMHVEAILFGQAGLLNATFTESYPIELKTIYQFLKQKYNLPPPVIRMKLLRMRPASFPTIRLAQLANLITKQQQFFQRLMLAEHLEQVQLLLQCKASYYWSSHYIFEEKGEMHAKTIGTVFINTVILNAVVPLIYAYATLHKEQHLKQKANRWLNGIKAEKNKVLKRWELLEVKASSAADSQALLELHNSYCVQHKCLDCRIAGFLLNTTHRT